MTPITIREIASAFQINDLDHVEVTIGMKPACINATDGLFRTRMQIAAECQDWEGFRSMIQIRPPLNIGGLKSDLEKWLNDNSEWIPKNTDDPNLTEFLSHLTWTNLKTHMNGINLQNYVSHLSHARGLVVQTRLLDKEELTRMHNAFENSKKIPDSISLLKNAKNSIIKKELIDQNALPKIEKILKRSHTSLLDEKKYRLEGWKVHQFLPLRIRSFILIYLSILKNPLYTKNTPFSDCLSREDILEKIIHQLQIDIEALRHVKTLNWMKKCPPQYEDALKKSISDWTFENLEDNPLVLPISFKGHRFYARLVKEDNYLMSEICNVGNLRKKHLAGKLDGLGRAMRYPYVFKIPYSQSETHFEELIRVFLDLRKMDANQASDALYKRYAQHVLSDDLTRKQYHPHKAQTTGNCTLANHNIVVSGAIANKDLYNWLINTELSIAKSELPGRDNESIGTLTEDLNHQTAREAYNEGLAYERSSPPNWKDAYISYEKARNLGHFAASGRLGYLQFFGLGTGKVNYAQAVDNLTYAADEFDPFAQFLLALVYQEGLSVDPDKKRSIVLLRKSAKHGNPMAKFLLGQAYKCGEGIDQNHDMAKKLYGEASTGLTNLAKMGDMLAAYYLGKLLNEQTSLQPDKTWIWKAAQAGFTPAMTEVAVQYFDKKPHGLENFGALFPDFDDMERGEEIIENRKILRDDYLETAANTGFYTANHAFGKYLIEAISLYEGSSSGSKQQRVEFYYKEALKHLKPTAEAGHAPSQYLLSQLYFRYHEVIRSNSSKASMGMPEEITSSNLWLKLLKAAADRGYPAAIGDLGFAYINGRPGLTNYNQGYAFMRRAADLGHANSMYLLAMLYSEGKYCIKDVDEALRYASMCVQTQPGYKEAQQLLKKIQAMKK